MAKRAGSTVKISISIDKDDLALLRRHARRLHDGNVSAAIAEAIADMRRREAGERLLEMLGGATLTPERAAEIDAEMEGRPVPPRKKARARRAA